MAYAATLMRAEIAVGLLAMARAWHEAPAARPTDAKAHPIAAMMRLPSSRAVAKGAGFGSLRKSTAKHWGVPMRYWIVSVEGMADGAFAMEEVTRRMRFGQLSAARWIYPEGGSAWVEAHKEFPTFFQQSVPPMPDAQHQPPRRPWDSNEQHDPQTPQPARPMASSGAIAAVLLTVFGAVSLTFGFGVAISGGVGTTPHITSAELRVTWEENEGLNESGTRPSPSTVKDRYRGYLVFSASQTDLCFDSIKENAGWPPDLGEKSLWGEGGLVSYSIEVTWRYASGVTRTARAAYIARTHGSGRYFILVPESGNGSWISEYRGAAAFPATPSGVVALANSE